MTTATARCARWLWLLSCMALALLVRRGHAQAPKVEMSAEVSANVVEIEEPFVITLKVLSEQNVQITNPQLRLPGGMQSSSPTVSTSIVMH